MSVVVVFDPGHSTGAAIFFDARLVETFTSIPPHDEVVEAIEGHPGCTVVCEEPPKIHQHQSASTSNPINRIKEVSSDIIYIRPSQWKNHPAARHEPEDMDFMSTRHERDAVGIGRWFHRMKGFYDQTNQSGDS